MNISEIIKTPYPDLKDLNLGIILVGIYIVFDLGSIQALYPIINQLRIPLILTGCLICYSIILLLSGNIDFSSSTTKRITLLILFIVIYAFLVTNPYSVKFDVVKVFVCYLSIYFIIIASVKSPSQFILLIDIWLVSIMFSSYNGIFQGGLIWSNPWFEDENDMSLLVAIAVPYALTLFRIYKSLLKRLFYILCIGFYISIIVVAQSRGGVLTLCVVALLFWLIISNKVKNLLIIVIASILVFTFAPHSLFEEMSTLQQGTEETTASDRVYLWGIGIEMFQDNPILGVGPNNYPYYFSSYDKGKEYRLDAYRYPHSTPIEWLAEMGIIGLILLLMLIVSLYNNWKSTNSLNKEDRNENAILKSMNHAIGISLIGFWFGSSFISLIMYPFFWIIVPFSEVWKVICLSNKNNITNTPE